jgi:hypothetical protein
MPAALSSKLKALPWQLTTFLTAAFVLEMTITIKKKQQVMPPNVNYYLLRCACVFLLWGGRKHLGEVCPAVLICMSVRLKGNM